MSGHSRSAWGFLLPAWAITAALACGSSESKSKDASDAASADFGNVPTAGSGAVDHATSAMDSGSGFANSGGRPANSGGGALDSGPTKTDAGGAPAASGGGPFDSGPLDASTDVSSNADWIGAVTTRVDMPDRAACAKSLVRDPKLDEAAQRLAENPNAQIDLKTRSMWKTVTAFKLGAVLDVIGPYVDENAPVCMWRGYGIGIVGEPGGNRRIVLLLAE